MWWILLILGFSAICALLVYCLCVVSARDFRSTSFEWEVGDEHE
jgi:hypothetical protein